MIIGQFDTYVHVMEALDDVSQSTVVGDVLIDLDLALEIVYDIDELLYIFKASSTVYLPRGREAQCGL